MGSRVDPKPGFPFFIVGSGRSGTTLLRMVLSSHSRISIPPETWFLLDLVEHLPLLDILTPAQVGEAVDLMTAHYRWTDLEVDSEYLRREAHALDHPTIRGIADIVYRVHAEREGCPRWGDKTPTYVAIVPEIAQMYPDARFIHLVRDGHDVAQSMLAQGWKGRWLAWNAQEWTEAIDHMEENRRFLAPDRLMEIRYEDLVLHTEAVARSACAFLGEAFEEGMLHWEDAVTDKVPGREMHIHRKLLRRPSAKDNHRWRQTLSAPRAFVLEAFIGERLRAEGYDLRFAGSLWRIPLKIGHWIAIPSLRVLDVVVRIPGALRRRAARLLGRGRREAETSVGAET